MRRRMWVAAVATMFLAGASPAVSASLSTSSSTYTPPSCGLSLPTAVAGPDLTTDCHPTTLAECEDTKVTVPAGLTSSSLYLKVAWRHPVWSAFLYLIDPAGTPYGTTGLGCDASNYNKGCGNQTTLPFDEVVVANPVPGA